MALAWSTSFTKKVNSTPKPTPKPTSTPSPTIDPKKQAVIYNPSVYTSTQTNSTNYVLKPVVKSAYDIQMEKIAQTEAFKNRTADENLKIHSAKIQGQTAGNTDNFFVNNKTGESSKRASDVTTVNMEQYLKERGLETLTASNLKPVKLVDERMASQNKTVFLRHEAEIKAQGGTVPELNLLNKDQVSKYNEISNIITQSKPDDSQQALDDVNSSVNSFLSLDDPITQKPKTNGLSQVQATGIQDSTVIGLGFTPEDIGDFKVPESSHKEENKDFVDKNQTSTGLVLAGVGAGILALMYLSKSKKGKE